jgi:hypothetical protein
MSPTSFAALDTGAAGVGKFFWTGWDMVEGEMMFTPELDIMT